MTKQQSLTRITAACLFGIILLNMLSLTACSSNKSPEMQLTVHSAAYLNPNIYDQAAPVVITVYQLKSPTAFQQADFFALYNDPVNTLGRDLLDKEEIEMQPNQDQVIHTNSTNNTNYIGIIAAFREPDKAQWRQIISVKPGEKVTLIINLTGQTLSAQLDKSFF